MATSGSATSAYPGRSAFNLYLYVTRSTVSGSSARWAWELRARNPNGSSQTYALDCFSWSVNVEGQAFSGCHNLDFRGGQSYLVLGSGVTGFINQGTGTPTINFSASHGGSIFGVASLSGSFVADRLTTTVPGAPPAPTLRTGLNWTQIPFQIYQPSNNGGSAVIDYQIQVAVNSTFTNVVDQWNSGASNQVTTGRTPGTQHWIRYRARNANGYGAWSPVSSWTTTAISAPTLGVVSNAAGTLVELTVTPNPSNVTPPLGYVYERRITGQTEVVTGTIGVPSGYAAANPGISYDWRVRGNWEDGFGPWSSWVTLLQPNPGTQLGSYFDGSTPDGADTQYDWDGTANNSTSRASGRPPAGWLTFSEGAAISGGSGSVLRQTGALSSRGQDFSTLVTFNTAAVAAGFRAGQAYDAEGRSVASEGGTYAGTILVRMLTRAQRMAAELEWRDAGGAAIGTTLGEAQVIAVGEAGQRTLVAIGVAPAGTAYVSVRAVDVAGTGWALWQGGEQFALDEALVSIGQPYPYFDGNTADTVQYAYAWTGLANASTSFRTTLEADYVDPLADPDCEPIPLPPTPPAIVDDCIEEVGTWRRYWAIVPASEISRWLAVIPTITLHTGAIAARQVRIRYYPNPEDVQPDEIVTETWEAEQIISYMPPLTDLVIDGVTERVRAAVNGADPIAADKLLYGTGGTPASWPILRCGIGYLISFDVPLDAPEGNLTIDVALTRRM